MVPGLAFAQNKLAGNWLVTYEIQDVRYYHTLTLSGDGNTLAGELNGATIAGTISGSHLQFAATDKRGKVTQYTGTLATDGTLSFQTAGDPGQYTARRMAERPPGPPQRFDFTPTTFFRRYSALTKPVLTVWPGDTIHTTTVDSGGSDGNGTGHGPGGNPETGPFYVEGALPGDTLAIHFNRIRLNRDTAVTSGTLVARVTTAAVAGKIGDFRQPVRWHLDRERGLATLIDAPEHLKNFSVPLRPMIGCIATAPRGAPMPAGDSGVTGGNMDSNDIVEGTTVYLPVLEPGGLLYLGDGHAVMGDGEVTGSGLETSMEVEFTVELVHRLFPTPRVETPTHLVVLGFAGSLDEAFRTATAGLMGWLEQDYKLTPLEAVQVLGATVEYSVNEVADRNAGVAARLNKKHLAALARAVEEGK